MPDGTELITALAQTAALRRALATIRDGRYAEDLLYLEKWEIQPSPGAAAARRINQLRRANPGLAAEIRAELAAVRSRPIDPARSAGL